MNTRLVWTAGVLDEIIDLDRGRGPLLRRQAHKYQLSTRQDYVTNRSFRRHRAGVDSSLGRERTLPEFFWHINSWGLLYAHPHSYIHTNQTPFLYDFAIVFMLVLVLGPVHRIHPIILLSSTYHLQFEPRPILYLQFFVAFNYFNFLTFFCLHYIALSMFFTFMHLSISILAFRSQIPLLSGRKQLHGIELEPFT